MIDYGLDINLQDDIGNTPLIKASLNSDGEKYVIYLLEAGANLEITNNLRINFSLGLVAYHHKQALDFLVKKKININKFLSYTLILEKQISQQLKTALWKECYCSDSIEPTITFFSLPGEQQIKILPNLEKETLFNFSDGDFFTDKALLVLANEYQDLLNSLSLNMIVLEENLDIKHPMLDYAKHNIYSWIEGQDWKRDDLWSKTNLLKSEWVLVRIFSRFIKHYLNIEIEVNKNSLEKIITDCLHP